jgi:hypothetical protein
MRFSRRASMTEDERKELAKAEEEVKRIETSTGPDAEDAAGCPETRHEADDAGSDDRTNQARSGRAELTWRSSVPAPVNEWTTTGEQSQGEHSQNGRSRHAGPAGPRGGKIGRRHFSIEHGSTAK